MTKRHMGVLQMLIVYLLVNLIPVAAQAPESYIIAIWSFDKQTKYEGGKELEADFNRELQPAILTMLNGEVDRNGKSGVTYVDNTCGVTFDPTLAINWDAVEGETTESPDDDAQLLLQFSTVDWKDIAFRFYYWSEDVESFDISYHLGDEDWKLIADDVVIDNDEEWRNIEVGLQDVDEIENREKIFFLIHDLTREFTQGEFHMDNIAILGERISSPIDCPPVLQSLNPIQDISVLLNSGNIPTFTGDDGMQFIVTDDKSSFDELTILALTSDPNVINQLGLIPIDKENGIFQLDIGAPHGYTGVANVTLQVTDKSGNVTKQVIEYGVSGATLMDNTMYYHGTANATASASIDNTYMVVANNLDETLNVYRRDQSGESITSLNVTRLLELPDRNNDDSYPVVDIEGGTQIGNRQYWIGSHSNSDNGRRQKNRYRLFATETQGQGDDIQLSFVGYYGGLIDDLSEWGKQYGYTIGKNDVRPDVPDGFNIEGFTIAPDGQTAYIGLRTPIIIRESSTSAVIVPLNNFASWFNNGNPSGSASFGDPIELNLGGLGIRGMECNGNGCLIIAGAIDNNDDFALYTWTGNRNDQPVLRNVDLSDWEPESVVLYGGSGFGSGATIQLINNNHDTDWYHTGGNTAGLAPNLRIFQSMIVTLD